MKSKEINNILLKTFSASPRKWRTARSIAKEAGLPIDEVLEFLDSHDFVKAKKGNKRGESLYSLSSTADEINLSPGGYKGILISSAEPHADQLSSVVSLTLMEIGVQTIKLDKTVSSAVLINNITDAIRTSDFIVVDISRNNANVYYELGYAHALRKPTILIMSSDSKSPLPSDLSGVKYIVYDTKNLSQLSQQIKRSALGYLNQKEASL